MKKLILAAGVLSVLYSCDFLEREPQSALPPEKYLTTEDNIGAYAVDLYNMFSVHEATSWGTWKNDNATDNMVYATPSDCFAPGYWKVAQTGGSYSFTEIYRCNYFFDNVLDKFEKGEISGQPSAIRHYVGEVYFFRAWSYFQKLMSLGDFPIIENTMGEDFDLLVSKSVRQPRNEVARFILSDLDKALEYMSDVAPMGGTNRLNRYCVRLLKSRVALYEGTWLKYFKGTAFVPNGKDWPGKAAHPDYKYPSGDIDSEISYFLSIAMKEAEVVADAFPLTENTGIFQTSADARSNPYFDMFGDTNMNGYKEVLLWKAYSVSQGVSNSVVEFAAAANQGYGITKSMVDAFVMSNGLPIYAAGSGYQGDADLLKITQGRDSRAEIFIKKPGETNLHSTAGPESFQTEPYPNIVNSTASMKYTTGYALRKGLNFDGDMSQRNKSEVGSIVFRAVEAYLNYMEASYELNGTLDSKAQKYWTSIRNRAKVGSWQTTIDNTDMTIEAQQDWGAWSAGVNVDATLFNIRRERRCELMAEGFRNADVRRWRSMDQMKDTPWHPLGVNLWAQLAGNSDFQLANANNIVEGGNVSTREFSTYLAPFHILRNNRVYDGYRWKMAHYLDPIAVQHFLITGEGETQSSTLYQNPYWPQLAGQGAIQ